MEGISPFLFHSEAPGLALQLDQLPFGRQVLATPVSGNTVAIRSSSAHQGSKMKTSQGSISLPFPRTGEDIFIPADPWWL